MRKGQEMSEFVVVEAWLETLRHNLDLDGLGEVDIPAVLQAVRQVAHSVTHPAGPLATLAIGYALGKSGGSAEEQKRLVNQVIELAGQWAAETADGPSGK